MPLELKVNKVYKEFKVNKVYKEFKENKVYKEFKAKQASEAKVYGKVYGNKIDRTMKAIMLNGIIYHTF